MRASSAGRRSRKKPVELDPRGPRWVRERRPWEISPTSWRYFLRGFIALFLAAAALTAVALLALRKPLDERVMLIALLAAGALVGLQWFGAVRTRHLMALIARKYGLPFRRTPAIVVLGGTLLLIVAMDIAIAGLFAYDGPYTGAPAATAVGKSILPVILVVLVIFLFSLRSGSYLDEEAVLAELGAERPAPPTADAR